VPLYKRKGEKVDLPLTSKVKKKRFDLKNNPQSKTLRDFVCITM
jgi:hypothetical protein